MFELMGQEGVSEVTIQRAFEEWTGKGHEKCALGVTDISGGDYIIEIKGWKDWKAAVGQLLVYRTCRTACRKIIVFFGKTPSVDRVAEVFTSLSEYNIFPICCPLGVDIHRVDLPNLKKEPKKHSSSRKYYPPTSPLAAASQLADQSAAVQMFAARLAAVAVQPVAVQPVAVQPVAVQPVAVQPVAVQPVAVLAVEVQPVAVPPVAVQPVAVQPVAVPLPTSSTPVATPQTPETDEMDDMKNSIISLLDKIEALGPQDKAFSVKKMHLLTTLRKAIAEMESMLVCTCRTTKEEKGLQRFFDEKLTRSGSITASSLHMAYQTFARPLGLPAVSHVDISKLMSLNGIEKKRVSSGIIYSVSVALDAPQ
jgi:hypothetical protein